MRSPMSDRSRQRLRTILTILVTALIIAPAAALATHGFDDVNDSDFYHAAVDWMKANDVTAGCNPPDNTRYCPDDPVTRGEMAVFFERLDSENVFVRPGDDAVDGGNADMVDGMHAADFLGANQEAVDSDKLDGKDSTAFLGADEQAVDSDELDGKDSSAYLSKTTRLHYTGAKTDESLTFSFEKLFDVGTFTKDRSDSEIHVSWNEHAELSGSAADFCHWQLRIDGATDTGRTSTSASGADGGNAVAYLATSTDYEVLTAEALFTDLSAGDHTVEVWVRGTASSCELNYFNFGHEALVTEYVPAP